MKLNDFVTGLVKVGEWADAMSSVMSIDLPWRGLRHRIAKCSDNGMVEYNSTFEDCKLETKLSGNVRDFEMDQFTNEYAVLQIDMLIIFSMMFHLA